MRLRSLAVRVSAALALILLAALPVCADPPPTTTYPAPWSQNGTTVSLAVTNSSSNVQLGGSGPLVVACNIGSNDAFVALGTSSGITATTTGIRIPAGQGCVNLPGNGQTYLAAITTSSTTTLYIQVGSGTYAALLPGGGSGGGLPALAANSVLVTNGTPTASWFNSFPADQSNEHSVFFGPNAGAGNNVTSVTKNLSTCFGENTCGGLAGTMSGTEPEAAAFGWGALSSLTSGNFNTAFGVGAMRYETTGGGNTAIGTDALLYGVGHNNVVGVGDNAAGFGADSAVVAIGNSSILGQSVAQGGSATTTASDMIAIGDSSFGGSSLTSPTNNVAVGYHAVAGAAVTNPHDIIAIGSGAMNNSTMTNPNSDVGIGSSALAALTTGTNNVGVGHAVMSSVTSGGSNVAVGANALATITTNGSAVAIGNGALQHATAGGSVAVGAGALNGLTSGTVVGLGQNVGGTCRTGSNVLLLGTGGNTDCASSSEGNTVHIGAGSMDIISTTGTNAPSTSATTVAGTLAVAGTGTSGVNTAACFSASFQLVSDAANCIVSLRALKHGIQPLTVDAANADLDNLSASTFFWNDAREPGRRHGFIADDVRDMAPRLATFDKGGDLRSYDVNGMVADLWTIVKAQRAELALLRHDIAELRHERSLHYR